MRSLSTCKIAIAAMKRLRNGKSCLPNFEVWLATPQAREESSTVNQSKTSSLTPWIVGGVGLVWAYY